MHISIPSTVHYIEKDVFGNCSALEAVEFCEEIEEFVSAMALRPWWNNGTSNLSLWTGSFSARCNIPERVGMIILWVWKAQIRAMLQSIPTVMSFVNDDGNDRELVNDYFFPSTPGLPTMNNCKMLPLYWNLPSGKQKSWNYVMVTPSMTM